MRIIVGVTGTTGVEMSYELLLALRRAGCEVHLIISRGAQMTWDYESRMPLQRMYDLANFVYQEDELDAVISSGSFVTDGMILMPCSMKTLAGIVAGYAETLIFTCGGCLPEGRQESCTCAEGDAARKNPFAEPEGSSRLWLRDRAADADLLQRSRDSKRTGSSCRRKSTAAIWYRL